jgi:hypothetical protein
MAIDSFVDLEDAEAYMAGVMAAAPWHEASVDMRERALVTATRRIRLTPMLIIEATPQQGVLDACCEEALHILATSDAASASAARALNGVTSRTAGDASESYDVATVRELARGVRGPASPVAKAMLDALKVRRVVIV